MLAWEMPKASPEAKSELARTSEAAQGGIKHFKRLPTDPLNAPQKLAISFFLKKSINMS